MIVAWALGYIGIFALVCLGLGWPLVARCDRENALMGVERTAAAFCSGTAIISLAVFFVGRVRLDAISMGWLSAVALLLAMPGLVGIPWRQARASAIDAWVSAHNNWGEATLWLVLIVVSFSALVQGMAPPNDYDSLMYHLAFPKLDVERGVIGQNWDRGMPHAFFAELTADLTRLILASVGDRPVQLVCGLYGIAAAMGSAALAKRVGCGRAVALLAAVLFLVSRAVVWEMATAEVEVPLAAFMVLALCALLAWRERDDGGLLVLCGLLLGAGLLVKFHGAALGLAMGLLMLARRPFRPGIIIAAAGAALILYLPHAVEMARMTGNPLFPMMNQVFTPGGVDYFDELRKQYGIGRDPLDLLRALWAMSVTPMQHFDGMVLGAPYFLALAPLAVFARTRLRHQDALLVVAGLYYLLWFYFLSQQVRFLMPIFPILAVWSAVGAANVWSLSSSSRMTRAAALVALTMLAANQAMFVGIYAAIRVPPALGLVDAESYHTHTPTMTGAYYAPCKWVEAHTAPDERILSLITPHSYYCPQAAATMHQFRNEERSWFTTGESPPMERAEFIQRFRDAQFRWVLVPMAYEHRRNDTGIAERWLSNLDRDRFGVHIGPVLHNLAPVVTDPFVAVYDGRQVLEGLEAH